MSISPKNQPNPSFSEIGSTDPVTLKTLKRMKRRQEPFACLACYDATTARWLQRAGVHLLLAGDSAAQVILGHDRTIHMPLDFAIQITAAIKRGAPQTLIMADMPFLSYHASVESALTNAARFMTEGNADVVKLEADETFVPIVDRMTRAGIPVCAHVGCRPQSSSVTGGPVAAGRTQDQLKQVVRDAVALQQAGAVLILIEAVPAEVTRAVMQAVTVPVIGIGAGTDCDGQILVVNDLLGLTDHPPRFAQPATNLGEQIMQAGKTWVDRVSTSTIGGQQYTMRDAPQPSTDGSASKAPKSSNI
ncbi:MAG: 3-methyl-2-oxobutanoate hydroxymethyltransferase [Phycisphaerales bacterium]|nr:3-methyl-2-oxobutanoate hydroxymethyltransferase [Phycisphaerales bacterium]